MTTLDEIRIIVCLTLLGIATISDVRTRMIPNWPWTTMIIVGLGLGGFELLSTADPQAYLLAWTSRVALMILICAINYHYLKFGGADIKALMAITIMHPTYPNINVLILTSSFWGLGFTTIANAAIITGVLTLAARTLKPTTKKIPFLLPITLGYLTGITLGDPITTIIGAIL